MHRFAPIDLRKLCQEQEARIVTLSNELGQLRKLVHRSMRKPPPEFVFIKDGAHLINIKLDHILFFKGQGNYIQMTTRTKQFLFLMRFKDLREKLPETFLQVHRSYIVHLHQVDMITKGRIQLGPYLVPVSGTYEKTLQSSILLLNG